MSLRGTSSTGGRTTQSQRSSRYAAPSAAQVSVTPGRPSAAQVSSTPVRRTAASGQTGQSPSVERGRTQLPKMSQSQRELAVTLPGTSQ